MLKLHLVSLGCARNLVDSEVMLGRLSKDGWTVTSDPGVADTIVVNTCSFIEDAADESIETILRMSEFKKSGQCRQLIVTGCLPERYREDIQTALPEVDCFLGTGAYSEIVSAVTTNSYHSACRLPDPDLQPVQAGDDPRLLGNPTTAYVKIAEGCSRHCAYCIIPKLRGRQKSRSPEDILAESERLIAMGVRELTLVAQDTTAYGRDLKPSAGLSRLLENLSALSPDVWIRVLYGHPNSIDDRIIQTIGSQPNVCSYFDIPIQHASNPVLKKMGRNYTQDEIFSLFDRIKSLVPGAALRTTVIVGFPGETEKDMDRLMETVEKIRFNHLGAFMYSDSSDLPSHRFSEHVPEEISKARYDRLMVGQQKISLQLNQKYVNEVYRVLIEESPEEGLFAGRTVFQAPEVDGITYVRSGAADVEIGDFIPVRITDGVEYDLFGEAA